MKQSNFLLSTFLLPFYMKKFISLPGTFYKIIKKKKDDSDDEWDYDDGTGYGNQRPYYDSNDKEVQEELVPDDDMSILAM